MKKLISLLLCLVLMLCAGIASADTLETDVVVVGGGGAGISAAIAPRRSFLFIFAKSDAWQLRMRFMNLFSLRAHLTFCFNHTNRMSYCQFNHQEICSVPFLSILSEIHENFTISSFAFFLPFVESAIKRC